RSVDPPVREAERKRAAGARRMGKRIVLELEGELFVVIHLMIAGRLAWKEKGRAAGGRAVLARRGITNRTALFTAGGTEKRASRAVARGASALAAYDRGGLEVLESDLAAFARVLASESHTLKRALTDPTLFSGIGNAYSDEMLHRAKLSPTALTRS